jgi:hypothetical protein
VARGTRATAATSALLKGARRGGKDGRVAADSSRPMGVGFGWAAQGKGAR